MKSPEDTPKVPYSEAKKFVQKTLKAVEAGVFETKEEAREEIKKPWEDGTLRYFTAEKEKVVNEMFEAGSLYVTKPWMQIPEELASDEGVAKIETGGEGQGLIFEHRTNAKKRGHLTANSSGQVLYEYKEGYEKVMEAAEDPEFVKKVKEIKGFALGDDDLGAAFTLWLLQKIKEGDDISQYEPIVRLVSDHDKRGRIYLYPKGESASSLVMTNWGVMLSAQNDKSKVAQYLTVFDYIARHPEHIHDGIPAPTLEAQKALDQWVSESREHLENAEVHEDYILCRNCEVLNGTTKWDQIGAEGYRKYDGKKAVITVSSPNQEGKKEMQISTYGYYYLPPFAEYLKKKGFSPWYGDGYCGMYTQDGYDDNNFIADYESYIATNREELENATEFEVVFDDKEYMEGVMDFALKSGLVTGYNTTPEYYQANASYIWDEYGEGSTTQKQTKLNRDAIQVVRFFSKVEDKEKIMQYLNQMFGKRDSYPEGYTGKQHDGWIAPLIKATDKGVNKKFAQYLDASSS